MNSAAHRKLMPTAMERVIWGSGDGYTLPVVTTDIGKIGAVICWENYMPGECGRRPDWSGRSWRH